MSIVTLFKNIHGYVNVVISNGDTIPFVGGRYWTEDEERQAVLEKLAKRGEHGIFIDPSEPTVDTEAATPMEAMKKKIIQEYLREQGTVMDVGTYGNKGSQLGAGMVSTASSVVMANGLAGKEAHAQQQGETILVNKEGQEVKPEPEKSTEEIQPGAGQQAALDKLKNLGKS